MKANEALIRECRQIILRLVCRAIIDDNDLDILIILPECAGDRIAEEFRPVVGRNDDGNAWSLGSDGASAGAPVLRSLIFQMPRHLSAQSPSPSSQCSLISRIGRGKKNGGR